MTTLVERYLNSIQEQEKDYESKWRDLEDYGIVGIGSGSIGSLFNQFYKSSSEKCISLCGEDTKDPKTKLCKIKCSVISCKSIIIQIRKQYGQLSKIPEDRREKVRDKLDKEILKWEEKTKKFLEKQKEITS